MLKNAWKWICKWWMFPWKRTSSPEKTSKKKDPDRGEAKKNRADRWENRPALSKWLGIPVRSVNTGLKVGKHGLWFEKGSGHPSPHPDREPGPIEAVAGYKVGDDHEQ